jgi:hypothetical protein
MSVHIREVAKRAAGGLTVNANFGVHARLGEQGASTTAAAGTDASHIALGHVAALGL